MLESLQVIWKFEPNNQNQSGVFWTIGHFGQIYLLTTLEGKLLPCTEGCLSLGWCCVRHPATCYVLTNFAMSLSCLHHDDHPYTIHLMNHYTILLPIVQACWVRLMETVMTMVMVLLVMGMMVMGMMLLRYHWNDNQSSLYLIFSHSVWKLWYFMIL